MSDPSDMKQVLEQDCSLSDIIPTYTVLNYVYDFGDCWQHEIFVEKLVDDGEVCAPVCMEGEGDAPPEDCGGEPGFHDFLSIMDDPSHAEHDNTKQWAEGQFYRKFNQSLINHRLKSIYQSNM